MSKTSRAHTNIALIKYWGKKDAKLRLPLMSSLSMTLDAFYSDTQIEDSDQMSFSLNGKQIADKSADRVFSYIKMMQDRYGVSGNLAIKSDNHVPTAAGLASSSSAFAALAAAFADHYHLDVNKRELSRMARMGSGSASRSIFGGFAVWQKGDNDESSYAYALDEHPQMDLKLLAVELNDQPKKVSSTKGMELSKTSPFYQLWLDRNDQEIADMEAAIKAQDFTKLGSLAELNASEMHSLTFTAQPGFTYFEPKTIEAIKLVQELREKGLECYYTIDAGPNIKILCQEKNSKDIVNNFALAFDSVKIIEAGFGPGVTLLD